MKNEEDRGYSVRESGSRIFSTSLMKGIRLLETVVDDGEAGISELARRTGINKSNAHRILGTLEDLGYVEKDPESLKYRATLKVFQMGSRVIHRTGLRELALPFLKKLGAEFGETVNLGVLERGEVVYIEKVESSEVLRMDLSVGRTVPAYCTALGKVLLAGLSADDQAHYVENTKLEKRTLAAIPQGKEFLDLLAHVRQQGFALDHEELDLGITCIAAPVRNHTGRVLAAISLAGPSTRMMGQKLDEIRVPLLDAALALSKRLGLMTTAYAF
jgi:IclR family transcriptional regulator, KDG regulon repressor